jgi:hypothetical protein
VYADAQELFTNYRVKKVNLSSDTILLDTLSLVPGSLVLTDSLGNLISTELYQLNNEKASLVFSSLLLSDSSLAKSELVARFRVFPFLFTKTYKRKDINALKPDESGKINPFIYTGEGKNNSDFFASEGLNKSGSISRGVAFGNNQDVVLNSNLNLQLSGKLTDKIGILAAIADDNIPIQPDGNTQQLQEFDRVYIQFNDAKSKLIAGDFQLTRPNSYFINYFKKSQGASFSSAFAIGKTADAKKNNSMAVSLSAAVSKGKFSRNIIIGVEGNQGPYRLKGAENESFVIVLSGSEKIYVDGQLMERGQDKDYVIDYNTAEITFTPRKIITKDKRITAEFQYSDRNYARSLYAVGNEYKLNKLALRVHLFSEQDNPKKPLLQELDTNAKRILTNIGDDLQSAIVPSIEKTGYLPNTILYKLVDTLGYSNVYVYSTDSSNALYQLSFSNVGSGKGNYNPVNTTANGRVYQWIAPVNGISQGSYEPVLLLITPKKKQLLTVAAAYQFSRNFWSDIELAYSKFDQNAFSGKNSKDDDGYGLRFNLMKRSPLSIKEKDTLHLLTGTQVEILSSHFSQIERFRAVEFEREWNRSSSKINDQQILVGAKIGIEKKSVGNAIYQLNALNEQSFYKGYQHYLSTYYSKKGYALTGSGSFLSTKGENSYTSFLKYKALASKSISSIKFGTGIEQEQSRFLDKDKDTLFANSFYFLEWLAFVQSADTSKNSFRVSYINRTDWLPRSDTNQFGKATLGQSITAYLNLAKKPNSVFKISGTYRKLSIQRPELTAQQPDNTLVTRVEYDLKLFKGTISSATFYEVGSGLEVKKEFTFLQVQPGQGIYQWIDRDSNNIQDISEFEVAAEALKDKAEFLKVFTPTNDFVKTFNNQFNEILNISPGNIWNNATGIKKFVSLFSNQTAYRIDRKTSNNEADKFLNPFLRQTKDTEIVSLNSSLRNTFFFNRFNSKFGADYSYQENKNKSLLVSGSEQRSTIFHNLKIRWNITRKWLLTNEAVSGTKLSISEFFKFRDFDIRYRSTEPKISYQPNVAFRLSLAYKYNEKKNNIASGDTLGEEAQVLGQKLGFELKYNKAQQGSLSAKFDFILFEYTGAVNSPLAYEMLEGLQPGKNYTWNLTYQRTLSNNIQLNLSYDGRKSDAAKGRIVHVGNVQVRAYF